VRDISNVQARLDAADCSPDGLPELLDAAWNAFDLLITVCRQCQDPPAGSFAAFSFALAAAAEGRLRLMAAPSLPPTTGTTAGRPRTVMDDLEKVTEELAGLAQTLTTALSSAGRRARDPGDQAACADAARQAEQILALLAGDP
jgi:hypothetical protein